MAIFRGRFNPSTRTSAKINLFITINLSGPGTMRIKITIRYPAWLPHSSGL